MKVKLDDYEVRVLINGLMQQHRSYDAETNGQIDALALRLCDIAEAMKPGRKKKISFEPVEIRVICQCLMEWRNFSFCPMYRRFIADAIHLIQCDLTELE